MAQEPSFSIDVRAPSSVRALLEQHLELRRYREVTDLDDYELARLIVLAERDARELVATLGFFDPRIAIRREQGADGKPLIVIEVEPGEITKVAGVKLDFEGDIAQHHGSRRHHPARRNPHRLAPADRPAPSPRTTGIGPSPTPCGSWWCAAIRRAG